MNNWNSYLAITLALVQSTGSIIYIKDTLKGVTQPNRITYLLWGAPIIAAVASNSREFSWSSIPTFVAGVMPLLIFVASFVNKKAFWRLRKTDYVCGSFALAAIVLWLTLKDPVLTITFSLLADVIAGMLTLGKCWKYPETETKITYLIFLICQTINLLNIKTWDYTTCAFPIYFVTINLAFVIALYRGRMCRLGGVSG